METIQLTMDDIEHRQIINIFVKISGIRDTIADLSMRAKMEDMDVWELVHKLFPDTEDNSTRYNPETKVLEIHDKE